MHSEREAPDKSRSWSFSNFPGRWSHFDQERRYLHLMTVVVGQNTYRQIFQPNCSSRVEPLWRTNEDEHL